MSDPAPLPPPPPVSEPVAYRPLSGFAIAGFAAACLFAVLVLGVAAVALVQGAPFFYSPWVLLLPAAGLVLSLVARGEIHSSDGTRAGERLAQLGIWISLICGLGYFVYYYVTGLAVTTQANAFLTELGPDSGFFPHLEKAAESPADFNAAFLLVMPAGSRGGVRPEDDLGMRRQYDQPTAEGTPGALTSFRKNIFIRLFTDAAPGKAHVETQGVQSWTYESRSYLVVRNYRISLPEAVVDATVPARSSEGEAAGEPRKWFVDLRVMPRPVLKLTDLGRGLQFLRRHARDTLLRWQAELNRGTPFDLAAADRTPWDRLGLTEVQRGYVRARLEDLFRAKDANRLQTMQFPPEDELGQWQSVQGKVQLRLPFQLQLDTQGAHRPYLVEGRIAVESKAPLDPLALTESTVPPEWSVRTVTVTHVAPVVPKKTPGGGPR